MKTITPYSRKTTGYSAEELYLLGAKYESKKKYEVAALNYIRAVKAGSEKAVAIFDFDFGNLDKMHVDSGRLAIIKEAAHNHFPQAEFSYGARYYAGIDVERNCAISFFWMERAAKQGHTDAIFYVAEMYRKGEAVSRDIKRAALMTLKAAIEGCAPAQYRIGKQILSESVSDHEDDMAFQWILSAAKKGCKDAIHEASNMMMFGVGTDVDTKKGAELIQKSKTYGGTTPPYHVEKMNANAEGAMVF